MMSTPHRIPSGIIRSFPTGAKLGPTLVRAAGGSGGSLIGRVATRFIPAAKVIGVGLSAYQGTRWVDNTIFRGGITNWGANKLYKTFGPASSGLRNKIGPTTLRIFK